MKVELRRPRLLLTCLSLVLVAGGALVFQDLVLADRADELQQLRQSYHTHQEREQQLYALHEQVQQTRAREQALHERIPDRLKIGPFLEHLGTHLAEHRAREIRVSRDDLKHAPPFDYVVVQVEFESTFETAWRTLRMIEEYGQGIRPMRVHVDREAEPGSELLMQVDLIAVAHGSQQEQEND